MPELKDFARTAPLPLRLIVGYGFFAHGLAKLERGPEHFASWHGLRSGSKLYAA
jgi:uncharacterized membrane protein YphA (DoxX/SURF4 family)